VNLPYGWAERLQSISAKKVMLLSLSPDGLDPSDQQNHLGTQPGAVRVSTHSRVAVLENSSGIAWPFPAFLVDWPNVQYTLAREQRRATIPQVTVRILATAGLAQLVDARGSGLQMTYRLDLWSPGITLENVIPLMAGVCATPTYDSLTGGVSVTLTDGDPRQTFSYPPTFTHEAFPEAPQNTLDNDTLKTLIGAAPAAVVCPPINQLADGSSTRFFVSTLPVEVAPTQIQKDGVPLTGAHAEPATTPSNPPFDYLQIVTDEPVAPTSVITCSGAVGTTDVDPITFLARIANYPLTPQAQALLDSVDPLSFQFLADASGDIWQAITGQLIPQTKFAATFRHGLIHLYDLMAEAPDAQLGLGAVLMFPLAQQPNRSDERYVYNQFTLKCGRDALNNVSLFTVYRDARTGGSAAIKQWLAESERRYGPRAMSDLDCMDLAIERDSSGKVTGSAAGEALADLLALLMAFQCRLRAYQADWYRGLAVDLNQRVYVTENAQGLDDAAGRVAGLTITATGPQPTIQIDHES